MPVAVQTVPRRAWSAALIGLALIAWPAARPSPSCRPERTRWSWFRRRSSRKRGRPSQPTPTRIGSPASDSAWQQALTEAGKSFSGEIRKEGDLLKPRAALPRPAPTPGSYNCRLIKLGQATPKTRAYESFKPFFCYVEVEDNLLTIVKQTGSQRPAGRLWEDDDPNRLIFLGSLALGNEDQPLAYGDDPKRNMAGVLRADRPVPLAAGDPVAAKHLQARRVRADAGRATAARVTAIR